MNEQRRKTIRLAGAIRGLTEDTVVFTTHEQKIASLRQYLGNARVLADEVWEYTKSTRATGADGWTNSEANRDAWWALASELEDPAAPGILTGTHRS